MDAFFERVLVGAASVDELLSRDFESVPGQKSDADRAGGGWRRGVGRVPVVIGGSLLGGWIAMAGILRWCWSGLPVFGGFRRRRCRGGCRMRCGSRRRCGGWMPVVVGGWGVRLSSC
ncbi:lantibiotic modifying enzyme domain protein [Mycobacterium kansasii]|uniref:Lantibiotic modifying enzyme domain protein n=1 Tax=Mycobacterium kansasii TaxID=1768 RepID=A0A1V3XYN0_MYCKA|nr:lantibiotic modifying enzyme domain protein [Mycobacterium kansasii]